MAEKYQSRSDRIFELTLISEYLFSGSFIVTSRIYRDVTLE
jgi:hypothetical protein